MSIKPKMIITMVIPGMPFDDKTMEEKGLGGSETAAVYMSREMAKRGHMVSVFSAGCRQGDHLGNGYKVKYFDIQNAVMNTSINPTDVLIMQRDPTFLGRRTSAKLNILWCHDLALHRFAGQVAGSMWNIDSIFVLSQFMKEQYKQVYSGIPDGWYFVTRNGIDYDAIRSACKTFKPKDQKALPDHQSPLGKQILRDITLGGLNCRREDKLLVYTSRPERGMDILLMKVWPLIHDVDKSVKLIIAGYDNYVPQLADLYATCHAEIAKYPDNIVHIGALTKTQLYRLYAKATAYVYPSNFEEVYGITYAECMACGLPVIGSDRGSIKEVLDKDAGVIISGDDAASDDFCREFAVATLDLLSDRDKRQEMGTIGREQAKQLDWSYVAEGWEEQLYKMFEDRTRDKAKLAHHFIWQSDIYAAEKVIASVEEGSERIRRLKSYLQKDWGFKDSKQTIKEHYEKIGDDTTLESAISVFGCPRWRWLINWLQMHPDVKRIIDFGCAYGHYSVPLANMGYEVLGITISDKEIEYAWKLRKENCEKPENLEFLTGDETIDLSERGPYDLLLAFEVLEHMTDPLDIIKMEKWIGLEGYVLTTTPLGPWEAMSYKTYPYRCHLWHLEPRDLRDMFGKKDKFNHLILGGGVSDVCGSPLGWVICEWKPSGEVSQLDWERKLLLQNPMEGISVCMIVKDAESMLHRALKSVNKIAEEIIVIDTGSTDTTKEIARKYTDMVFDGSDPLVHGFEAPRNESLAHATSDWQAWVDSDEELLNVPNLGMFLRKNMFNGYAIRQHHVSLDPPNAFHPDLPIRLFRNNIGIKFFGKIHEHPEFELNKSVTPFMVLNNLELMHDGFLTEAIRRKRFNRNIQMMLKDREKYPDRILGKFLMMRDWVHIARYEIEATGGRMTQNAADCLNKAIDYYRTEFLPKPEMSMLIDDGLSKYSEALALLNKGHELLVPVHLSPNGIPSPFGPGYPIPQQVRARFLCQADLELYLKAKAYTAGIMESKYI